jgi:hypothetical protein
MRNGRKKTATRRDATTARFERPGPTPTTFTGRPVFGAFVPFAAETVVRPDGWIVLAYAVAMKTSKVTLARQDFEDCVRNFAAYPCCPVTIEHADTADDPFGALPKEWKEPSGHIEELRVGEMTRTVGGQPVVVATLEGRPSYEASVVNDVGAKKKWRFGSITILQGAVDEETGQKLGSMLWSWSLTAHPRLTGLPAIAASKKIPAEGEVVQAGYWWGDIDSREDLLECIKTVLDLPVTYTRAIDSPLRHGRNRNGRDHNRLQVVQLCGRILRHFDDLLRGDGGRRDGFRRLRLDLAQRLPSRGFLLARDLDVPLQQVQHFGDVIQHFLLFIEPHRRVAAKRDEHQQCHDVGDDCHNRHHHEHFDPEHHRGFVHGLHSFLSGMCFAEPFSTSTHGRKSIPPFRIASSR